MEWDDDSCVTCFIVYNFIRTYTFTNASCIFFCFMKYFNDAFSVVNENNWKIVVIIIMTGLALKQCTECIYSFLHTNMHLVLDIVNRMMCDKISRLISYDIYECKSPFPKRFVIIIEV